MPGIDCTQLLSGGSGPDAAFIKPDISAEKCQLKIQLPSISFKFKLPSLNLPFPPPLPSFGFKLSCDPSKPIDVSVGLSFGGGRVACMDPSPDEEPDE